MPLNGISKSEMPKVLLTKVHKAMKKQSKRRLNKLFLNTTEEQKMASDVVVEYLLLKSRVEKFYNEADAVYEGVLHNELSMIGMFFDSDLLALDSYDIVSERSSVVVKENKAEARFVNKRAETVIHNFQLVGKRWFIVPLIKGESTTEIQSKNEHYKKILTKGRQLLNERVERIEFVLALQPYNTML